MAKLSQFSKLGVIFKYFLSNYDTDVLIRSDYWEKILRVIFTFWRLNSIFTKEIEHNF